LAGSTSSIGRSGEKKNLNCSEAAPTPPAIA
jgi:hypothetical protein